MILGGLNYDDTNRRKGRRMSNKVDKVEMSVCIIEHCIASAIKETIEFFDMLREHGIKLGDEKEDE